MAQNWPHIPELQWEMIPGLDFTIFWYQVGISNTVFSMWVFTLILFLILLLFKRAVNKDSSKLKTTWIIIVRQLYNMSDSFIWNKKVASSILFLTWWMFIYILLSNIFWLILDWIALVAWKDLHAHTYLRPMNADPNTTFALSIIIVLVSHMVMIKTRWVFGYLKWYIFNFSWKGFEKLVNVFLGWLHLISEFVKALSLSLRLFWNIFAWIVLITIIAFLWQMISLIWINLWELFVLPFWFFELFVAFIQALVFFTLSSIYFQQAIEEHH